MSPPVFSSRIEHMLSVSSHLASDTVLGRYQLDNDW